MARDQTTEERGIEMDDGEVVDALTEFGHGTLSLASESESYGVPVSFGYDGEQIFLNLLQFGDSSKKIAFSKDTDVACLNAYQADSKHDWRSVVVTGTLQETDDDEKEYADSVLEDNAWFPNLFAPTDAVTDVRRMVLQIEDATGRKGADYQ